MSDFCYPHMPMYASDQMAYMKQMYDWHMKMVHYHEQKRMYHQERVKHFLKMMEGESQTREPIMGGIV